MRLRKRHAWGAALIALFVLPVWRPDGFPGLEGVAGSFFGALAEAPATNPRLWRGREELPEDDSPRARALEKENAQLWERLAQFHDQRKAEEALRAAWPEPELDRLPLHQPAVVVRGADAASFRQSVLIDRGSDDGVVAGLAVTDGGVFVGCVKAVHGGTSLVQLLTDPYTRLEVAVRTEKGARLKGYLRGSARGRRAADLEVRFVRVPLGESIAPGAAVVTSNADDRVPPGLLVGFVTEVDDPDADGMPVLEVRPALDPDRLLDVFVLRPR